MEFIKKWKQWQKFCWCPESVLSGAILFFILGIVFIAAESFMFGIYMIICCVVFALIAVKKVKDQGFKWKRFLIFLCGYVIMMGLVSCVMQDNDNDRSSDEDIQQQEYNEKLNEIEGEYEYYQDNDNYNKDFGDKYGYRIGE